MPRSATQIRFATGSFWLSTLLCLFATFIFSSCSKEPEDWSVFADFQKTLMSGTAAEIAEWVDPAEQKLFRQRLAFAVERDPTLFERFTGSKDRNPYKSELEAVSDRDFFVTYLEYAELTYMRNTYRSVEQVSMTQTEDSRNFNVTAVHGPRTVSWVVSFVRKGGRWVLKSPSDFDLMGIQHRKMYGGTTP